MPTKSIYEKWADDGELESKLLLIEEWARDGLIDVDIAKKLGIHPSTLYEYKNRYHELKDALKRGKKVVDDKVENALLKKALGFKETLKKPIKCKTVIYENGKRVKEKENIVFAEEEIFVQPDTVAQIFWLKNRKPEKWRDKIDAEYKVENIGRENVSALSTEDLLNIAKSLENTK